jgi:hypothetical protein
MLFHWGLPRLSKMPQSGAPPAQLNVFDFLFNRGGMKFAQ